MEEKSWFDEIQGNAIWNGELRFHVESNDKEVVE